MKALLPSLKENQRYVVFEIDKEVKKSEALKAINAELLGFLGELYYGKAGIQMISERFNKNRGIIRTSSKYVNEVKMGLGLIKNINDKKVNVNAIGVSGTLKKAESKFMKGGN